jgi:DNA transformation protein
LGSFLTFKINNFDENNINQENFLMPDSLPSLIEYFLEQLSELQNVSYKPMFGGYAFYLNEKIFAILGPNDAFFIKRTEGNKGLILDNHCMQWIYESKNETHKMNYYIIPEEVLENREVLQDWVKASFAV